MAIINHEKAKYPNLIKCPKCDSNNLYLFTQEIFYDYEGADGEFVFKTDIDERGYVCCLQCGNMVRGKIFHGIVKELKKKLLVIA